MYFKSLFFLTSVNWLSMYVGVSLSDTLLIEKNQKILQEHNSYRKLHHVPDLEFNETIREFAQKWADNLATSNQFEHQPNIPYGENLWRYRNVAGVSVNDLMVKEEMNPVKSWYAEKEHYPSGTFNDYGHYTQLVWKSSKFLGCGIGSDANKQLMIVVCNYDPAGNVEGQFSDNVLPSDGTKRIPFYIYAAVISVVSSIILLLCVLLYTSNS